LTRVYYDAVLRIVPLTVRLAGCRFNRISISSAAIDPAYLAYPASMELVSQKTTARKSCRHRPCVDLASVAAGGDLINKICGASCSANLQSSNFDPEAAPHCDNFDSILAASAATRAAASFREIFDRSA
jgi:hypothetical protein